MQIGRSLLSDLSEGFVRINSSRAFDHHHSLPVDTNGYAIHQKVSLSMDHTAGADKLSQDPFHTVLLRGRVGQVISADAGLLNGIGCAAEEAVRARRCQSTLEHFAT